VVSEEKSELEEDSKAESKWECDDHLCRKLSSTRSTKGMHNVNQVDNLIAMIF